MRRWFLGFLWIGLQGLGLLWAEPARLADPTRPLRISQEIQLLPEPSEGYRLDQVAGGVLDGAFRPLYAVERLEAGRYWLRIPITNQSLEAEWTLRAPFGFYEIAGLDRNGDGRLELRRNSVFLPLRERADTRDGRSLPLRLEPGTTRVVYVRGSTLGGSTRFSVELESRGAWELRRRRDGAFLMLSMGGLLALGAYNLLLFGSLRDRSYGYYSASLISLAAYMVTSTPLIEVPRSLPIAWVYPQVVFSVLPFACFTHFTRHFLDAPVRFPIWDRFWQGYSVLILVLGAVLMGFLGPRMMVAFGLILNLIFLIGSLLLVAFGIHALRRGFRPARAYLQANVVAFLFVSLYLMGPALNLLDLGWLSRESLKFGFLFQMILFSQALADRFRILQAEKAEQERKRLQELARLTEEKNRELEHLVADRTAELASSHRRLLEAQGKLAHLMESPRDLLEDIPAWAAAMAGDLQATLGLAGLGVYEVREGRLETLFPVENEPAPDLGRLLEALQAGSRFGDLILIGTRGLTGDLRGFLLVKGLQASSDGSERQLLNGFASHLGGALEMARVRQRLVLAEARHVETLEALHGRGIETLSVCPLCGRCFGHQVEACPKDGARPEAQGTLPLRLMDRYRFLRRIGVGGMGTVFEARDQQLARSVAIKLMKPELFNDQAARLRFEREIQTLAQVHHPGVVTVHDSGVLEDGSLYLIMEYLQGLDLAQLLRRHGAGSPVQVAQFLRQGADALHAAHVLQIIHRDLKPQNFFVVPKGSDFQIKVLDFGLAKSLGTEAHLTQTGFLLGTPAYMAPEQVLGRELDVRTDLYTFAAVAYEALVGLPVVKQASMAEAIRTVLFERVTPPSQLAHWLDPGVDDAFAKGLAKTPEGRPDSLLAWALELADQLEAHPSSTVAWPTGAEAEAWQPLDGEGFTPAPTSAPMSAVMASLTGMFPAEG